MKDSSPHPQCSTNKRSSLNSFIFRWVYTEGRHIPDLFAPGLFGPMPDWMVRLFLKYFMVPGGRKFMWRQGIGRHTQEEVETMGEEGVSPSEFIVHA